MKRSIRRIFSSGILLLVVILTINTLRFRSHRDTGIALRKNYPIDTAAVSHLQEAVNIRSISYEDSTEAGLPGIDSLIGMLEQSYPNVFSRLKVERINGHSLLLTWKGTDSGVPPVLLYAHMDVVPVEQNGKNPWRFDAFGATIEPDTILGRGCIDDKSGVIGILESINRLLERSFVPKRDVYIAFGHDEEIGGEKGAAIISDTLQARGIRFAWILDEGGMVAENMVPFVTAPVALVMTAEKGYMTVELSASGKGGHSSYPPKETPVEIITAALTRIHDQPFERKVIPALDGFMDHTGPEMRFPFNVMFANRWLFGGIILNQYENIPEANAMIRTTSACTILSGGVKENVIPSNVTATINLRLLPGDNSDAILRQLKEIVHDERVALKLTGHWDEASKNSSTSAEGFEKIRHSIRSVFPDAIVAPSISIGATDSRHFSKLADNIYRFLPIRMNRSILSGMHGTDERIPAAAFMETIAFYEQLIAEN